MKNFDIFTILIFLKFVISVRCGHCHCSPRA